MTPEERAYDVLNRVELPGWGDDITKAFADAIRAAVAEATKDNLELGDRVNALTTDRVRKDALLHRWQTAAGMELGEFEDLLDTRGLRAVLAEASAWRPIAEMPKDHGKPILVWDTVVDRPVIACWIWNRGEPGVGEWKHNEDRGSPCVPSFGQPLPPPPRKDGA